MSGRCTGVLERIREVAPNARYIHCSAHNLNLVLLDCVKNNKEASDFFALIQALYVLCRQVKFMAFSLNYRMNFSQTDSLTIRNSL